MARGLTIGIEIDVAVDIDEEIRKTRGVIADRIEFVHDNCVKITAFVGITMIDDTWRGVLNEGTHACPYKWMH
jgi:hypothetical protein